MSLMLSRLYAALKLANIPDDAARSAAEEVAAYESALADVHSDIKLIKWTQATLVVLVLLVLGKVITL